MRDRERERERERGNKRGERVKEERNRGKKRKMTPAILKDGEREGLMNPLSHTHTHTPFLSLFLLFCQNSPLS